ncbi:MAG: flavodoxin domain-containing protein [Candidatus Cloacimonetes bacterium]|nr:flavodoxin domain-containing protein [Candidatus Cloacimonadota bacterium]MCF7882767.1 flavodoxin domain-containing protein [Candidatus Cloacimonadota bacterium]
MKTLIVFTTNMGSVAKSAEILKNKLGSADLVNLKNSSVNDLNSYDSIVLGGSIYAGRTQKEIRAFAEENLDTLLKKKIGIFVNSAEKGEKGIDQIKASFPHKLVEKATALGLFGDEIDFAKCNLFYKLMLKIKGVKESYSNIDEIAIKKFADKILKN